MAFRMNAAGSAAISVLCIEFQVEDFEYKILEFSWHVGLLCECLTRDNCAWSSETNVSCLTPQALFFTYRRGRLAFLEFNAPTSETTNARFRG